jgi:glycosyltransferase involved in cell wall biosynthesis
MAADPPLADRRGSALMLSYAGLLGGAERVLLDCATRLECGVAIGCPEGALADAARAAGLRVAPLPERALRLRRRAGRRGGLGSVTAAAHAAGVVGLSAETRRLCRDLRPDALVAWGARAGLAAALLPRRARPPLLAVHCDLPPRGMVAAAVRRAARRADGVAALSEAIARSVAPGAAVLHPGVDLAAWTPAPPPPPVPPRALVLGVLVPWKRPDLALDIAARVPELRLEIAGAPIPGDDPGFEHALRRRAAAPDLQGRVAFLGALGDPRPALARAHCLLHCADAEPYGLALVEALAAGRPVVAPAAGGPLEIVADAGRLYPPGDARAAARAVEAVIADPGLGAAARARAEARFSVDASTARLRASIAAIAPRLAVPP